MQNLSVWSIELGVRICAYTERKKERESITFAIIYVYPNAPNIKYI